MCLITDQKEPKVAEQDITVYKILEGLTSPYNYFHYELGKLYETEIEEDDEWCCFDAKDAEYLTSNFEDWERGRNGKLQCFGAGFHSISSIDRAREFVRNDGSMIIYEAIIPKGAQYYENGSQLAISNKLIIVKELENELSNNQGSSTAEEIHTVAS